jgi:Cof subfamily protein (haloacid dehalogenase superfamily)
MIYKLLAINIDGTLLQSNGKLTKETREAIEYVQEKGIYVTLFTGRNFQSAKKIAKVLKIPSLLITHSGAFISSTLEEPIFEKRIDEDVAYEIIKKLEKYDCNLRISHEHFSIGNRKKMQSNLVAKAVLSNADPVFYPIQFVDVLSNSILENSISPLKIECFFSDEVEKNKVRIDIEERYKMVECLCDEEKRIEIVSKGVSKLNGLKKLGDELDIAFDEMVVIGDSFSDLQLIERAGLGVAMGNAPIAIKKAADWITRSNNQNGVPYMVVEHFRKQFPLPFLRNHLKLEKNNRN